jgi:hypothetical protein
LGDDVTHDEQCNKKVNGIKTICLKLDRQQPKFLKNPFPVHDAASAGLDAAQSSIDFQEEPTVDKLLISLLSV